MSSRRPRLAFVSPVFLFPADTGGRIRTTGILRGLKGGAFEVTLACPASAEQELRWQGELHGLCDRFVPWKSTPVAPRWRRVIDLCRTIPVNVAADRTPAGVAAVRELVGQTRFDVVVFDFVHSAVLRPTCIDAATVCFTHNVEAEIFDRHAAQVTNPLMRRVWSAQHAKMLRFEREQLGLFTTVVAVSERNAKHFREQFGLTSIETVPTGIDLDFYAWAGPPPIDAAHPPSVVFTGSMDSPANVDGIERFLADAWPLVLNRRPDARLIIVGRSPSAGVLERARSLKGVRCTGCVPDVRPYLRAAHVSVIPLRVGSGTRIKAVEAMAMGVPVVSTTIGIEGLELVPNQHFLQCDASHAQAAAILRLLENAAERRRLSVAARQLVEQRLVHRVAARAFEKACLGALARHCATTPAAAEIE